MEIHLFDDCDIFAITVSRSITKKGSTWIGILVFFVLQYVLGWFSQMLSEKMQRGSVLWLAFHFRESRRYGIDRAIYISMGALAFEVILAALIVYATVYLIDRKVEV